MPFCQSIGTSPPSLASNRADPLEKIVGEINFDLSASNRRIKLYSIHIRSSIAVAESSPRAKGDAIRVFAP